MLPVVPLLGAILLGSAVVLWVGGGLVIATAGALFVLTSTWGSSLAPCWSTGEEAVAMRGLWLIAAVAVTTVMTFLHVRRNEVLQTRLTAQANTDVLTDLPNRRALVAALSSELERARRVRGWLAIVLVDVDHFKRFNDTYGHLAGDACLEAVGQALRGVTRRAGEVVGRWGGEEFLAVLPGVDRAGALTQAERMREAVAAVRVGGDSSGAGVTITCGVVALEIEADVTMRRLIRDADAALYEGKAAGRDRTVVFSQGAPEGDGDEAALLG